jgi:Ni,Fe-hydrogenase III large subunit
MEQRSLMRLSVNELTARSHRIAEHRPWPRAVIGAADWERAGEQLGGGQWALLGLWAESEAEAKADAQADAQADSDTVHMAVHDETEHAFAVFSLACPDGRYPSIGRHHAPAIRLERTVRDLFGLEPQGLPDRRPWLDHGRWETRHPLGRRAGTSPGTPPALEPYAFLGAEGDNLHQIPVGPVHAGIIEPGHFRFTAAGETVVRLEARLGYTHKGIESLMAGSDLHRAARLAGRTSGDSTVAYQLAFARAAEAALEFEPPGRATWLRALLAELERLANHLGDIGGICNDAAFTLMHAQCHILREQVLRANVAAFGHRLLRDCILPGGITVDLTDQGRTAIGDMLAQIRRAFPALVELYDNTASLQDRTVGTGFLRPDLARRFAAGGYVGRASARHFDARSTPGYTPYDQLEFEVPVFEEGDVNARVWVRIREVEQSLSLVEQLADRMPAGALRIDPPTRAGEGLALVEGFRGDVLIWLRLGADGRVRRCHLRDPSWFQWPLLEAAIEGNIVADFPLCNKSFNCSYSGHDL